MTRPYRIGTGAGFSADRLDPAVELVERGALDCIVFECVGELEQAVADFKAALARCREAEDNLRRVMTEGGWV